MCAEENEGSCCAQRMIFPRSAVKSVSGCQRASPVRVVATTTSAFKG